MPPKSPAGKKAKESVTIFSSVAIKLPKLSAVAARCIALGGQIESLYGAILTTVLGANATPAAAMYRSLQSQNAQLAVVHAAAKTVLSDEEMDIFSIITAVCNRALKSRNHLAHWVWGMSGAYPDAIVLIDPVALLEYETGLGRFMWPNEGRVLLAGFDVRRCLVYDANALKEAEANLVMAEDLLAQFRLLVIPLLRNQPGQYDPVLRQLKRQSGIAEGLRALEKQRLGNPAKRLRLRGRGRPR